MNRERASGTYHMSTYLISKTVVEIPRTIAVVVVFVTIVYWMIYLNPTAKAFVLTCCIVTLTSMCAESLTICISVSLCFANTSVSTT